MAAPEAGTPIGPPLAVATGVPVVSGVGAGVVTGLAVAEGVGCPADAAGAGEYVQFGPWAAQPTSTMLTVMAATKLTSPDRSIEYLQATVKRPRNVTG